MLTIQNIANKGDFNSTILIKAHGQTMYELDRWDAEFEFSKIFEILRSVYDANRNNYKTQHRSPSIQSIEIWQRIEWVDSGDIQEIRMTTIKLYEQAYKKKINHWA